MFTVTQKQNYYENKQEKNVLPWYDRIAQKRVEQKFCFLSFVMTAAQTVESTVGGKGAVASGASRSSTLLSVRSSPSSL